MEGLSGCTGCDWRCDSGRSLRLRVCLHLSCGVMGCKLGTALAVIGRQGGSHAQGSPRPSSCSVTSNPIPRPISVRRRASAPGWRGRRRVRGRGRGGGASVRSRAGRLRSAVNAEHHAGGRRVTRRAGTKWRRRPKGGLTRRLPAWSLRQAASPTLRPAGTHSGTRVERHVRPVVIAAFDLRLPAQAASRTHVCLIVRFRPP